MMNIVMQWIEEVNSAPIGLQAYLCVAAALFAFGLLACISRRNSIGILIGIELILNAAILNFMAFWRFGVNNTTGADAMAGPLFGVFVTILAACGAAISLAILLNLYFNFGTVETHMIDEMKQ
ncbi:NADH-quinone oxidoreductase subunit NuoK [Oligoflexia bacterium]|nr:NADH-quinone oxidoreductase subunit NuoK [Oligoflexia bacterium]